MGHELLIGTGFKFVKMSRTGELEPSDAVPGLIEKYLKAKFNRESLVGHPWKEDGDGNELTPCYNPGAWPDPLPTVSDFLVGQKGNSRLGNMFVKQDLDDRVDRYNGTAGIHKGAFALLCRDELRCAGIRMLREVENVIDADLTCLWDPGEVPSAWFEIREKDYVSKIEYEFRQCTERKKRKKSGGPTNGQPAAKVPRDETQLADEIKYDLGAFWWDLLLE
ncbi:hypothetical protein TeGR_g10985 [Tetraparma gracilis]|uniref:Uncharacterized protein n=1 Tax=Tetraparma gracilis TaxID=2962635 RepID=A0ABQ6MEP3_9STRA|nr:hypothetical protein TeGR_g10985 [Tetraparma gracilis]